MSTDLVIILSTDWVESTATRARIGEEPADALQELHDALLRRAIEAAGGRVVKHSGDGVLATFRSATAALGAALQITDDFAKAAASPDALAPMRVRVGLAAGEVKNLSNDVFGLPVVEAVRLQAMAKPGEPLCSELVRVLCYGRGGFGFEDAGTHELKGLPRPVHALRVKHADPAVYRPQSSAAPPRGPWWSLLRPVGVGVLLLVPIVAGALYVLRAPAPAPVSASAPAAAAAPQRTPLLNSVAVLPFTNMSPNADDAYFAEGIHEELLTHLSKLRALTVIARPSVLRYSSTSLPLADIARELNVQTVVTGSVRYAGNDVRIATQLVDPVTGTQLWSDVYQRRFDDIFAIQADIAMNIANALRAEFSAEEQRALEQPATTSPEAYALYLRARATLSSAQPGAAAIARTLLDRATALDPNFARAYGRKAIVLGMASFNTSQGDATSAVSRAAVEDAVRETAGKALALDPREQEALVALRELDVLTWHWSGYEERLAQADPRYVSSSMSVWMLAYLGKPVEAVRLAERVVALNPADLAAAFTLGVCHAYAGDFAASRRWLGEASELDPTNPLVRVWVAYNAIVLGEHALALEELRVVEQTLGANRPTVFLPELAYAYSRIGRADDAARVYRELEARGDAATLGVGAWALGSLGIGDEAAALRWLEAAAAKARNHEADAAFLNLMNLKMNFLADPRLEQPQFAEVLSRIHGD